MLYDSNKLISLVKEAEQKGEGIWVRLKNEIKICLMRVENEQYIAKFFPCAKNSRAYQIPHSEVWKVEMCPDTKEPARYTRAVDHGA